MEEKASYRSRLRQASNVITLSRKLRSARITEYTLRGRRLIFVIYSLQWWLDQWLAERGCQTGSSVILHACHSRRLHTEMRTEINENSSQWNAKWEPSGFP